MIQEFTEQIKNTVNEIINDIHTATPGKIVKYYPDKGEADILPFCSLKLPSKKTVSYPTLCNVPILFLQSCGQSFSLCYPIREGDECLIISQESPLDIWRNGGGESENDLKFDLTNSVAIVGLFAKANKTAKKAQDENKVIIGKGQSSIEISDLEIAFNAPVVTFNASSITGL